MAKIKMPSIDRKIMSGHISVPKPLRSPKETSGKVILFDSWCKQCGICTHFCPTGALQVGEDGYPYLAHPEKCTLCGMCWRRCPDLAIVKGRNNGNGKKDSKSDGGKDGKG
ncbi:MAG: 4Fe-4S binding protein [Candidatus Zixiibacteriota bacterium]